MALRVRKSIISRTPLIFPGKTARRKPRPGHRLLPTTATKIALPRAPSLRTLTGRLRTPRGRWRRSRDFQLALFAGREMDFAGVAVASRAPAVAYYQQLQQK